VALGQHGLHLGRFGPPINGQILKSSQSLPGHHWTAYLNVSTSAGCLLASSIAF
jgi:hypothetical protein